MATITISMPDSLKEFVDEQVRSKGYGNVSEYFRSLVRDARQRDGEAQLEHLLMQGLESGQPIAATEEFWADLRQEALRLAKQKGIHHKKGA